MEPWINRGLVALAASALVLAACRDPGSDSDPDADADTDADADLAPDRDDGPEVDGAPDGSHDAEADRTPGDCSRSAFAAGHEAATVEEFGIEYGALTSTALPFDTLRVAIYREYEGPTAPGTYSLDGFNFADCGLCVLVLAGCGAEQCEKIFYAEQGTVEITALGSLGDRFAARLTGVVLDEVTIDETTFVSTRVPGGETWCIDGHAFDQEIQTPDQAFCGRPDINCVGETVPDFSLQGCETGEMVSLYDRTASASAALVVLTAGWCPACAEYVPQVVEFDQANASRGLEVLYVLGEDQYGRQPSLDYCRSYARRYSSDGSAFFVDHDGTASFATVFTYLWPYIDANGVFALPWNAVIDGQTHEYVYGDGSGVSDLNTALEELLAD